MPIISIHNRTLAGLVVVQKRGFVPLPLLLLLVSSGQARNIGHGLLSTGPRRQMQCRVLLYHETPLSDL
jgi:hypothetical protein